MGSSPSAPVLKGVLKMALEDVKTLRDRTGAGLMDCKNALSECNGDLGAAERLLKERGLAAMITRERKNRKNYFYF